MSYVKESEEKWEEIRFKDNEFSLFLYQELIELARKIDKLGMPEQWTDEWERQDDYIRDYWVIKSLLVKWDKQYLKNIIAKLENKGETK
ncbi:Hypothetical protein (part of ICE) [Mycoplasma mycoides subsp. capri LC str. 95010]|uniref:Uncharacterized protein n=1 Tax=Mycoplasma mycoides subsp. capri LC str. 95010 TaxID=862259 RepID=F4MPA7_MYCML|nr:hypothetical protein [Mycoplasma mycoides]CBW53939.1 Hypothetical protein (part of ICE) [Mycoplasma mycoides subsp. capri LC str. 95010]